MIIVNIALRKSREQSSQDERTYKEIWPIRIRKWKAWQEIKITWKINGENLCGLHLIEGKYEKISCQEQRFLRKT